MNRKQMWKIMEEKGMADKAFELEKSVKRKPGSGRIARKSVEVLTLTEMKQNISQFYQMLPSILGKLKFISYTTMEEFGKIKNYNI